MISVYYVPFYFFCVGRTVLVIICCLCVPRGRGELCPSSALSSSVARLARAPIRPGPTKRGVIMDLKAAAALAREARLQVPINTPPGPLQLPALGDDDG